MSEDVYKVVFSLPEGTLMYQIFVKAFSLTEAVAKSIPPERVVGEGLVIHVSKQERQKIQT